MKNGVVKYNIGSGDPEGEEDPLSSVSMNYWGFHPSAFKHIEDGLFQFMKITQPILQQNTIFQTLLRN